MAAPLPRPRDARRRARACAPGCRSAYDNPRELGADRLVNAVAGFEKVGGAVVVVDFGTALTFDVVSERRRVPRRHHRPGRGDLAGGAHLARGRAADDRPHAAARADRQVHRRRDPLRRHLRLRRQVDGILGRLRDELGEEHEAIATGGLAGAVAPLLRADRRGRRPAHARPACGSSGSATSDQRGQLGHRRGTPRAPVGLERRRGRSAPA